MKNLISLLLVSILVANTQAYAATNFTSRGSARPEGADTLEERRRLEEKMSDKKISEIKSLAVISFIGDGIQCTRNAGFVMDTLPPAKLGIDSNAHAKRYLTELLTKHGYKVENVNYSNEILKGIESKSLTEISKQVAESIHSGNPNVDVDAYVLIFPSSVDYHGREHNSFLNFGTFGIFGLVTGELGKDKYFVPTYHYASTDALSVPYGSPTYCLIGLNAVIFDLKTNSVIIKRTGVSGRADAPKEAWPKKVKEFSGIDTEALKAPCLQALSDALRRALEQVKLIKK